MISEIILLFRGELYYNLMVLLKKVYRSSMNIHQDLTYTIDTKTQSNTSLAEIKTIYFLGDIQWEAYELHLPPYLEEYFN